MITPVGIFPGRAGVYVDMRTWLRAASLGGGAAAWVRGQESIGWEYPWSPPTWQREFLPVLLAVIVLCAHWWFLSWLTRRRLKQTGWLATRFVWPTATLTFVWLAGIAVSASGSEGVAGVLAVAVVVNLPVIPVMCLGYLLDDLQLPGWILASALTVAAWFCWWAIIVFFERRARDTGPVTLKI